jgi:hypothetical protein
MISSVAGVTLMEMYASRRRTDDEILRLFINEHMDEIKRYYQNRDIIPHQFDEQERIFQRVKHSWAIERISLLFIYGSLMVIFSILLVRFIYDATEFLIRFLGIIAFIIMGAVYVNRLTHLIIKLSRIERQHRKRK